MFLVTVWVIFYVTNTFAEFNKPVKSILYINSNTNSNNLFSYDLKTHEGLDERFDIEESDFGSIYNIKNDYDKLCLLNTLNSSKYSNHYKVDIIQQFHREYMVVDLHAGGLMVDYDFGFDIE